MKRLGHDAAELKFESKSYMGKMPLFHNRQTHGPISAPDTALFS